ncbi:MAG: aminotransferase class I/II-fold pyridoxal phosphate-dependent enzyme [Candidatus Thorarchaeota archaeon]
MYPRVDYNHLNGGRWSLTESAQLDALRSEIERITLEIIDSVGRRNSLAEDVAKEKASLGAPVINRDVENHLREAVVNRCREVGVEPDFGARLLNQLILESIRLQRKDSESNVAFNAHDHFVRAKEMEHSGREVIHLEVGEPDFGPPDAALKAMAEAVDSGCTHYTPSAGISSLREKIADRLGSRYDRDISREEVIVTLSGKYALFLSMASTIQAGEEVIIIDPSFPAYSRCVRAAGGRPIIFPTDLDNGWDLDVDLLQENVSPSTRMIMLNSPCNPTGKVFDESTMRKLVALAVENDISVVSDEVYSRFSYSPHTSILQFPHCNQVTVKSFSKQYGMTGFRLGYAVSDKETIKKMASLQHLHVTCVPEFIQHAGLAALDCEEEVNINAATIRSRLDIISKLLDRLPVTFREADGGFYIFARLAEGTTGGQEFAERLLSETGVCVMPGIVYGSQYASFFRVAVCQPEDRLVKAVERMEEVLR